MTFAWLEKLPQNSVVGVGVFLLVLTLVILSKKLYEHRRTNPALIQKGALCVKRANEQAVLAQQVKNPLLALTRANYAMAYLNIARDLALDDELAEQIQIPISELREDVEQEEERARDRILKLCPQLIPSRKRVRQSNPQEVSIPSTHLDYHVQALQEQQQVAIQNTVGANGQFPLRQPMPSNSGHGGEMFTQL